jgi:hypothetical protein
MLTTISGGFDALQLGEAASLTTVNNPEGKVPF